MGEGRLSRCSCCGRKLLNTSNITSLLVLEISYAEEQASGTSYGVVWFAFEMAPVLDPNTFCSTKCPIERQIWKRKKCSNYFCVWSVTDIDQSCLRIARMGFANPDGPIEMRIEMPIAPHQTDQNTTTRTK
eukprot:c19347_g1_i8.p2 GENE.c19347_g1_i8~~c19347_g1_i8.p2  ORF type:complete len:131 (-),score=15.02 c19347_g1_i8:984-1376(-)